MPKRMWPFSWGASTAIGVSSFGRARPSGVFRGWAQRLEPRLHGGTPQRGVELLGGERSARLSEQSGHRHRIGGYTPAVVDLGEPAGLVEHAGGELVAAPQLEVRRPPRVIIGRGTVRGFRMPQVHGCAGEPVVFTEQRARRRPERPVLRTPADEPLIEPHPLPRLTWDDHDTGHVVVPDTPGVLRPATVDDLLCGVTVEAAMLAVRQDDLFGLLSEIAAGPEL